MTEWFKVTNHAMKRTMMLALKENAEYMPHPNQIISKEDLQNLREKANIDVEPLNQVELR